MSDRPTALSPIARRVAGLVIGLMAALSTVMAVSVLTDGGQLDLILPLGLFIVFGSGAVALSRKRDSSRTR
jgi:flagellar motor component MotA